MRFSYVEIRKRCLKPDEAVKPRYARFVTHTLSTAAIWLFQNKGWLTPNRISFVSLVLALMSVPFFVHLSGSSALLGALLIEAYYVLDAMDGQWARLKGTGSLTGAFFDYLINYIIQPAVIFSIGWGVFQKTNNPYFLLLAFLGAFSSLWVLLIWDIRASILLHAGRGRQGEAIQAKKKYSLFRRAFSAIRNLFVFPWFMSGLTACALISVFGGMLMAEPFFSVRCLSLWLLFYGGIGPFIAAAITAYWIVTKKIDH